MDWKTLEELACSLQHNAFQYKQNTGTERDTNADSLKLLNQYHQEYLDLLDKVIQNTCSLKLKQLPLDKRLPTFDLLDRLKNICLILYSNIAPFLSWFRKVMDLAGASAYVVEKNFTLTYRKQCLEKLAEMSKAKKANSLFDLYNPSSIGVLFPQQIYPYQTGRNLLIIYYVRKFLTAITKNKKLPLKDYNFDLDVKETKEQAEVIYQKFCEHHKKSPHSYFEQDRKKHLMVLFSGLIAKKLWVFKRSSIENLGTERYISLEWTRRHPLKTLDSSQEIISLRSAPKKEQMRVRINKFGYYPVHLLSITGDGLSESRRKKIAYDLSCPSDPEAYIANYGVHDFEKMLNESLLFSDSFVVTQHPKIFSTAPETQHSQVFSVDYFSNNPLWEAKYTVLEERTLCPNLKQTILVHAKNPDMIFYSWKLSNRSVQTQSLLLQHMDQFKLSCLRHFGGYSKVDFWPYAWVNKNGMVELRVYIINQMTTKELDLKINWPFDLPKNFFSEIGEQLWEQMKLQGLGQFVQEQIKKRIETDRSCLASRIIELSNDTHKQSFSLKKIGLYIATAGFVTAGIYFLHRFSKGNASSAAKNTTITCKK